MTEILLDPAFAWIVASIFALLSAILFMSLVWAGKNMERHKARASEYSQDLYNAELKLEQLQTPPLYVKVADEKVGLERVPWEVFRLYNKPDLSAMYREVSAIIIDEDKLFNFEVMLETSEGAFKLGMDSFDIKVNDGANYVADLKWKSVELGRDVQILQSFVAYNGWRWKDIPDITQTCAGDTVNFSYTVQGGGA